MIAVADYLQAFGLVADFAPCHIVACRLFAGCSGSRLTMRGCLLVVFDDLKVLYRAVVEGTLAYQQVQVAPIAHLVVDSQGFQVFRSLKSIVADTTHRRRHLELLARVHGRIAHQGNGYVVVDHVQHTIDALDGVRCREIRCGDIARGEIGLRFQSLRLCR